MLSTKTINRLLKDHRTQQAKFYSAMQILLLIRMDQINIDPEKNLTDYYRLEELFSYFSGSYKFIFSTYEIIRYGQSLIDTLLTGIPPKQLMPELEIVVDGIDRLKNVIDCLVEF